MAGVKVAAYAGPESWAGVGLGPFGAAFSGPLPYVIAALETGLRRMANRLLKLPELSLLLFLLRGVPRAEHLLRVLYRIEVTELDEAQTGSLRFISINQQAERRLGEKIASTRFLDEDGVPVFVALYLDQRGELYELDCWKVDDTPLRQIPAF